MWPFRSSPGASRNSLRWKLWVGAACVLVAILAVCLLGQNIVVRRAHQAAARHIKAVEIGPAERWLDWAERIDPGNPQTSLLRAAALRRLTEYDRWQTALNSAQDAGASAASVQLEKDLGAFRWGAVPRESAGDYEKLIADGATPRDAIHAVVHAQLAWGQPEQAQQMIDSWVAGGGDETEASFLRGVSWWWEGERQRAQTEFEKTLEARPGDEMTRLNLVMLFEDDHHYREALALAAPLLASAPNRASVRVQVAGLLRKVGRLEDARQLVALLADRKEVSDPVAVELASIEYESGNYKQAEHWFEHVGVTLDRGSEFLQTAASNYAYAGQRLLAWEWFVHLENVLARRRQTDELQRRLGLNPGDAVAQSQLRQLSQQPRANPPPTSGDLALQDNAGLFARHCATCHGEHGEGDGRAARHLFPRPRNLANGKYRLVSTHDLVPTLDDIERVIRDGMPGTSMPPFATLSAEQRTQLAREVLEMYRSRFGDRSPAEDNPAENNPAENSPAENSPAENSPAEDNPAVDNPAVDNPTVDNPAVDNPTVDNPAEDDPAEDDPAEDNSGDEAFQAAATDNVLPVPPIEPATAESLKLGRATFSKAGCQQCHATGEAAAPPMMFDDDGLPSPPRDLVRDPFKGGADGPSLFRRIRLGMPGTPHPASPSLSDEEIVALVHFVQSLGAEPKRQLTNYQRWIEASRR